MGVPLVGVWLRLEWSWIGASTARAGGHLVVWESWLVPWCVEVACARQSWGWRCARAEDLELGWAHLVVRVMGSATHRWRRSAAMACRCWCHCWYLSATGGGYRGPRCSHPNEGTQGETAWLGRPGSGCCSRGRCGVVHEGVSAEALVLRWPSKWRPSNVT